MPYRQYTTILCLALNICLPNAIAKEHKITSADCDSSSKTDHSEQVWIATQPDRFPGIKGFWIDKYEVTNAQFAQFVKETAYVTVAEKPPPFIKGAPAEFNKPGGAVFKQPKKLSQRGIADWWQYVPGVSWKKPLQANTKYTNPALPVVQIAYEDAIAYANWAGRALPTEQQWEYAAKAGATTFFPWGDQYAPDNKHYANTWQGNFPLKNDQIDGFAGIAPGGCFPANNWGLHDMIGNVWEWVHSKPKQNTALMKGGSFLCSQNYCARYHPAAKFRQELTMGTNHIGFRTVKPVPSEDNN